jgi:hypothetical protein
VAQVILGQIDEASHLATFSATALAGEPKPFYNIHLARLYNPNRDKYTCRDELRKAFGA